MNFKENFQTYTNYKQMTIEKWYEIECDSSYNML